MLVVMFVMVFCAALIKCWRSVKLLGLFFKFLPVPMLLQLGHCCDNVPECIHADEWVRRLKSF